MSRGYRGPNAVSSQEVSATDEAGEVLLRDGRRAVIRVASVRDADGVAALGRVLAEAGDGTVMTADQVRSVEDERRRIDDVYRAAAAGDATVCFVALVGERVVGLADLKQLRSEARRGGK